MLAAPRAEEFPTYPQSWYWLCRSRDLGAAPVSFTLLGRRLVGFRTSGGPAVVLDARCSHLGADLGHGRVVGDAVQCPFHHWEYGADGACRHIPSQAKIPAFARQRAYAVAERHGSVFVFHGQRPLFPLPFFAGCQPNDFRAGRRLRFVGDCSWHMLAANNSDRQHWNAAHDRRLLGPPVFDLPHPYARRVRFQASVVGGSPFDRLLRRFVGDTVSVSITNWGGVFFTVTGQFRHARSYILISAQPLDENRKTQVDVIVFVPRSRFGPLGLLVEPLSLWLRRLFTWGFMHDEFQQLAGIRYSPHTLIEADRDLIDFFRWAARLPGDGDAVTRNGQGSEVSYVDATTTVEP